MIKGRDIIIVGQQPWDVEIGSNCKNIAIEFSKNNRVLYVNSPLDRITAIKRKNDLSIQKRINIIKGKEKGLIVIENNLWNLYPNRMVESINWINNQRIFEFFNHLNNKKFAKSIIQAVEYLGFTNLILFNDNDIFKSFYLKDLLQPRTSIYYCRDYMLSVDYWKKHGEKLEPELISKSDICLANSSYLANYCKKYNLNSYNIGQGCDIDEFSNLKQTAIPADIQSLSKPIIGYVGALIGFRLNISLLEGIAKCKPNWSIVLVGPEDEAFEKSELHQLSNVYFLGSKLPSYLPTYINSFDVCLNPQILNEVTIGNYPRKIDEYLAMGKPVVATKTPFMEEVFSEYTYLGQTTEDFVLLINKALDENTTDLIEGRKAFASTHSWEENCLKIYHLIEDFENN